jgi:hypothetical protein
VRRKLFGYIGSLITYLHLDKLFDTITYDLNLCYDLLVSVRYIKVGINYVASLFDNMYQVINTSMVAMVFTSILLAYFGYWLYCRITRKLMITKMSNVVSDFVHSCFADPEPKSE